MTRLIAALGDWSMGACLAAARPGLPVLTYGDGRVADALADAGARPIVVPTPDELTTEQLLASPQGAALLSEGPSLILAFKPQRRVEELAEAAGCTLALAPASLAGWIENKLNLPALAAEAGVRCPESAVVLTDGRSLNGAPLPPPFVVQAPRGFAGRKTWLVRDEADWQAAAAGRPRRIKITRWIEGVPGTTNAIVDATGNVLRTAPIVQVTGDPDLTPFPLGSCGNDFTWRAVPHPGAGPGDLAAAIGRALSARGYRGHFGIDWVLGPAGLFLIEVNARPTASFALYAAWEPALLDAHLDALAGSRVADRELPPLPGGQLLVRGLVDASGPPLDWGRPIPPTGLPPEGSVWAHPGPSVAPAGLRGRWVTRGLVVDAAGRRSPWPAGNF